MARDVGELLALILQAGALHAERVHRTNGLPVPPLVSVLLDASERQETPQLDAAAPLVFTYAEVCDVLRISPRTLDRLVQRGELATVDIGGSARVRRADLETYIASLEVRSGRAGSGRAARRG